MSQAGVDGVGAQLVASLCASLCASQKRLSVSTTRATALLSNLPLVVVWLVRGGEVCPAFSS